MTSAPLPPPIRASRARAVGMAVAAVVLVAIVVVSVVHLLPSNGGGSGLPRVLSVIPETSGDAIALAGALANNTSGGPWTSLDLTGWDATEGLTQAPTALSSAPCALSSAGISGFGVLPSNSTYWTGYASGWFVVLASNFEGTSNLFVWVGDGIAYPIGELIGTSCAEFPLLHPVGSVFSSTGAASAAALSGNFTRFVQTFPVANATYALSWSTFSWSRNPVPLWSMTFTACNGTVPELSTLEMWGSNGTVRGSTFGPGSGAVCGSALGSRADGEPVPIGSRPDAAPQLVRWS